MRRRLQENEAGGEAQLKFSLGSPIGSSVAICVLRPILWWASHSELLLTIIQRALFLFGPSPPLGIRQMSRSAGVLIYPVTRTVLLLQTAGLIRPVGDWAISSGSPLLS